MERVLAIKANYLAAADHDVTVVTADQGGRPTFYHFDPRVHLVDLNVRYDEHRKTSIIGRIRERRSKDRLFRERLEAFLLSSKPDITISLFCNEAYFLYKIKDGSPKILETHFNKQRWLMAPVFGLRRIAYRFYAFKDELTVGRYDRFVVLSDQDLSQWARSSVLVRLVRWFTGQGCIRERLQRIYNPSSLSSSSRSGDPADHIPLSGDERSNTAIAVGRYDDQKDFKTLIHIWEKVSRAYPDWTLEIYGDGPLREELQRQISSLGLEQKILLMGNVQYIQQVYERSAMILMTSLYEGLPMTLIEAISHACPPISYSCPCGPADLIVDAETGFLVEAGDEATFVQRIIQMIESPELRKRLGDKSLEFSRRFELEVIMQQWERLISELAAAKASKK